MSKTILPVAVALWLAFAAIGAWNVVAFAVAVLAAVGLGTYLLARAVTEAGQR